MSVIINMLKDLEQRQQPETDNPSTQAVGEFVRPQIQYQTVAKSRSPLISLIVVAVLLIPTLWFGVSMYRQANMQIANQPKAISDAASTDTESLTLSQALNHNDLVTEPSELALNASSTMTPKSIEASRQPVSADTTQDNMPVTNETSLTDLTQVDTASKGDAEQIDTSSPSAQQASVQEPETVNSHTVVAATVASKTSLDKISVSSASEPIPDQIASNQTAQNNPASNNADTAKAITATQSSGSSEAAVVEKKPAQMSVKEVVISKAQMAQLQYRKGMDAEQARRLDDAAGYYLEAIILQPSLHKARIQLVEIYYAQNNMTTAMGLLESGISMFPQQWEFYVILSRIQTEIKAYDAALATLAMIPDNSTWARDKWIAQTDLAQTSKNFTLAEAAYRNLLVSESTQSRWWMGLAYALDSQTKYSQAAQAYRSALSYEGLSTSAMTFIEKRLDQLGENR